MWSCLPLKRVIHQQTPDQGPSCPKTYLGSYPPRYKTKDQPMPQTWVLWNTSRGPRHIQRLNCLVPDQEPQSYTGGPLKGLYCLVPDQEPQLSTVGPYKGLLLLGPRQRTPVIYWGPFQGSSAWSCYPRLSWDNQEIMSRGPHGPRHDVPRVGVT